MSAITPCRLLAVSGSLRAKSINTAVLQAAQSLAPTGMDITLCDCPGSLPHFNPDLDTATPPTQVVAWREAVDSATALLISTPEYAHGVPGVLKNALDWLVSHEPFLNKPVAIINARPGAIHAPASLRETLTVMNARLLEEACITLPLTANRLDADTLLRQPAVTRLLTTALATILTVSRQHP